MNKINDIHAYITQEENAYDIPVFIVDDYEWGMKEHVRLSTLYKNSRYSSGNSDDKPFKNIIRPILNVQYRAEGFDVKDIDLFVDSPKDYYKSFLVRKYHDKWARENDIDTFIDEMVESYVDYGGALVKNVNSSRPEVVPLRSLVFCDQTDILSSPIGIKHFYSPDQLKEMAEYGWGEESNGADATIDEVIVLAQNSKDFDKLKGKAVKTPGKYIEVYEVHGTLPKSYLDPEDDSEEYETQLQITTFYTDESGIKKGLTLFKGKEKESPFKLVLRDKIYGRALGLGGAEELFESQVWTNYDQIRMKAMLDAASKIVYKTTDQAFASRNNLNDIENNEILVIEAESDISQINTSPINLPAFQNNVAEWEAHAQTMGAANESIMGESPKSGTPFALQQLVTAESHSLHEYRKGKLATFLDEVYRDWIIPYIVKELQKEQEFIAELSLDELEAIADNLVVNESNSMVKEEILSGRLITKEDIEVYKQTVRDRFMKGDNKRFIKILNKELSKTPINVKTNIVGKQKYLAQMTDKLVNVFRQIIATPQVLDDPRMAKLFNEILESSGLSPVKYQRPRIEGGQPAEQPQQGQQTTEPLQELATNNQ